MSCTELPGPAHALLGLLTTTARRRKHTLVVTSSVSYWAECLAMDPADARMWRDDLVAANYIRLPEMGRTEIIEPCHCNKLLGQKMSEKETHLSDAPAFGLRPSAAPSPSSRRESSGGGAPYLGEGAEHTHTSNDDVNHHLEDIWLGIGEKQRPTRSRGLDRKPVERWSGYDLACYFNKALAPAARSLGVHLGPGGFAPLQPMARNFSLWFRQDDELTPEIVKAMVDRFMARLGEFTAQGQPAWKAFISRRQQMWASVMEADKRDLSRDIDSLMADRERPTEKSHRPSIEEMLAERQAYLAQPRSA